MIRAIVNSQLQVSPADTACPSRTGTKSPGAWFEVANLSPYAFELLDDAGQVRGIAGPFAYTAVPMSVVSDHITLHAVGTLVPAAPLAAANWAVYAGLTKHPRPPASLVTGSSPSDSAAPSNVRIQAATGTNLAAVGAYSSDAIGVGSEYLYAVTLPLLFSTSLNGALRARSANAADLAAQSGLGVAMVAAPGNWSVVHTPAAGIQAIASRVAGAAGVQHICAGIIVSFGALAAPAATLLQWNLRDGASGAGPILASGQVAVPAVAFASIQLPLAGLSFIGSAATAMTLEFSAALANLAQGVTLFGYDAS